MNHASRRAFLATSAAALSTTTIAGCLSSSDGPPDDAEVPDTPATNAPIPENPSQFEYATLGTEDATVNLLYFGNWKCPHCASFSTGFFHDIVEDYVIPGDVLVQFLDFVYIDGEPFLGPDAPRAGRAGLSVWHNDPESYWDYHEFLLANQPSSRQWATTDTLVDFMEKAGVSQLDTIRSEVDGGTAYENHLQRVDAVASEIGVTATPMLYINGEVVSAQDEEAVRNSIEDAL